MTSILNLDARYFIQHRAYKWDEDDIDNCYFLYFYNELLDVYGSEQEAKIAAYQHAEENK